jgi:hypothetical protein
LLTPLILYYAVESDPYMIQLAALSAVALISMALGFFVVPKLLIVKPVELFAIKTNSFIWFIFLLFILFLIVVIATAKSIPLFQAFKSRDPYELAIARANFLKAREGYEKILVYINSILTSSFVPYIILQSFIREYPSRWFLLLVPYLYSFIFIEKIFFLKFILPFLSLTSLLKDRKNYKKYFWIALLSIPVLIYINTVISGFGGGAISEPRSNLTCGKFYSANYSGCANNGHMKFIAWRIIAVPTFTAADSLRLFDSQYNHKFFMGKTSSAISIITRQQNIKFEREVFKSEWSGEETGTASANSGYIIEQFVNFGWLGIILSSLIIGYIFAILRQSKDYALASLTIIFSLGILFGGFMATMLSAGFLFLFGFLFFAQLE